MTGWSARCKLRRAVRWGLGPLALVFALGSFGGHAPVVNAGTNPRPPVAGTYKWQRFGKLDTLYRVGDWTVLFWSKRTKNLYAWYGKNATVVIEMVRAANGWWHWRKNAREKIVWSDGSASRQKFDYRPWMKAVAGMGRSSTKLGARVSFKGSSGITVFEIKKDGLQITTPDKGVLTLGRKSSIIKHVVYNRSKTVYHQ